MTPMLTGIVTDIAFIIVVCQKRLLWFCFQKHNMSLATAGCAQENLKVMKLNLYKGGGGNRNFILI